MAEREYQRLTRSRRRNANVGIFVVSQSSLWLGSDHLLCIETNGYTENYKRFYFRDIQAIITFGTKARTLTTVFLAALAALLILIGFLIGDKIAIITFGIIAFITCLIPLGINLLLGPTCKCQIRTAVQTEELPIRRVSRARKIRDRLRPLIAEAQGLITPEEVRDQMQALVAAPPGGGASPVAGGSYVVDDPNLPPRMVS